MLICDYIVEFLIDKKITDVFGYPGGMVTYLMDSFSKHESKIMAHVNYHEQGAAFAACGNAQVSGLPGVAYATSGPGATNLLTGIANAYFDSIPCIFITGQVNTYEAKGGLGVRQKGFQETDIVSMARPVTKYAKQITDATEIREELEKAFYISMEGRKGPVLLDVPMNIQRTDVDIQTLKSFGIPESVEINYRKIANQILKVMSQAEKPLIIAGAGISSSNSVVLFRKFVDMMKIPVVTSMISVDVLPADSQYQFGFIGAYGHRWANFATAKSDLILTLGTRMDCRQTGSNKENFAPNAQIVRIDIDADEVTNHVKPDEQCFICDLRKLMSVLVDISQNICKKDYSKWLEECNILKTKLSNMDGEKENILIKRLSKMIPEDFIITTDVGQNQVWVSQSFLVKSRQRILYSGGHGAMGYSLPAAIGAYYACHKPVICITGDGGLQMNIQELQFIEREQLPIKIVLMNNKSLGMIRHFQEMYFHSDYMQTTAEHGYTVPDFCKIAQAYGIRSATVDDDFSSVAAYLLDQKPFLLNILCRKNTHVFPKLGINRPIYDQEPLIDRQVFEQLSKL
jgi:acetolactate synthase-1/2/3 large subunit